MWELLAAIFGSASIATRVAADKASQRDAAREFESEQEKLKLFREFVTNERTVSAVNALMYAEDSIEVVAKELAEVFALLPELKGKELLWAKSNHRPPASNWFFVEFVLCVKRGCVPLTQQFHFSVSPYYIGNEVTGRPKYISMSESSCHAFAKWVTKTLGAYGNNVRLEYRSEHGHSKFVWTAEPESVSELDADAVCRDNWSEMVTNIALELSIKSKLETDAGLSEAQGELRRILSDLPNDIRVNNGMRHIYLTILMAKHGKVPMEDCCRPFCRYGLREPVEQCTSITLARHDEMKVYEWLETTLRENGMPEAELVYQPGSFAHGFSWKPFASVEGAKRFW